MHVEASFELKSIDPNDLEDCIRVVEHSFQIRFAATELESIETFGQFCGHVRSKLSVTAQTDCTTQQAFYRFRKVLATVLPLDVKDLLPKTQLKAVLPPRSRRLQVKRLQTALGFNLNLLRPPVWITTILLVTALVSLGLLFLNWKTGLSGLILSGTGLHLAWRLGTRFTQPTVGAVAQHMMTYQYAQSRRTSGTVNTSEVETVLKSLFRDQLGLEIQALSKEARFR